MAWVCESCGSEHQGRARTCVVCGRDRARPQRPVTQAEAGPVGKAKDLMTCPLDGTPLERGYCRQGNGYPGAWDCPLVCPLCRRPLHWDGACSACRGSPTPWQPETWMLPGDRYDLAKGHWVKTEAGPRPVVSRARSVQCARELAAMLAGLDAGPEGQHAGVQESA